MDESLNTFEVVVGNVGTVYRGDDFGEAVGTYSEYRELSQIGYGSVSGESVALFEGGDILYITLGVSDVC